MSWIDTILDKVTPQTKKPIIVLDPQKFLLFAEFQERLSQDGYTLVFANPGIEVRMKYELEVSGKEKAMLVILGKCNLVDDMRASSFVVELSAKNIFRNFDERAIAKLSYKELCKLDKIQVFKELSFEDTKKIVEEKIKRTSIEEEKAELAGLLRDLQNEDFDINDEKSWFAIAPKIGEAGRLAYMLQDTDLERLFIEAINTLNGKFQQFLEAKYESLFTRTGIKHPYTIDKVQDFIAANSKNCKVAFIVIDGMNLWQWDMLKNALQNTGLTVQDKTTLSWLPSITAWARQSIFSGKKPDFSIDNRTEGELFKKYWAERQQKLAHQLSYERVGTGEKLTVPHSDVVVAGFVINALDDMMHGNVFGYRELYLKTELWIKQSAICSSIKNLRDAGFDVYISTDHGNVEANLCLKLSSGQKAVMNSRSKRFVQFDTEEQAALFITSYTNFALGQRGKSVYFKDTSGFGTSGKKVITHGGSHILELLIPVGVIK